VRVDETYRREGVYARITGTSLWEVRPDEEGYALLGPGHKSIHRGYFEAVKEGVKLASKPIKKVLDNRPDVT
jgi:hypothetical protein